MKFLLDPRIFNYVILVLYTLNIIRWSVAGSIKDAIYWLCAAGITATVTFGYDH